ARSPVPEIVLDCEASSTPAAMPAADSAPTTPAATSTLRLPRFGRGGSGGCGYCSGSHGWYGWVKSVGSGISLLQAAAAQALRIPGALGNPTRTWICPGGLREGFAAAGTPCP